MRIHRLRYWIVFAFTLSLISLPAIADDQHDHAHFGDTGKLGTVHFQTSCAKSVQPQFERAVAILHSFWYEEADKAFRAVTEADPNCAMAWWGAAMSLWHPLWLPYPDAATLQKGVDALAHAKAITNTTQRERDYIAALSDFYEGYDKNDHRTRALAYEKAMEQLAQRYPDDREASIFYALALNATALPTDKTYANARKAGAILEKVFKEQPNHPGVAHYIIHSYDNPVLAERALPAARSYAKIAPSVPHAQHMPSHIFIRLGLWDEAIASNLASQSAARDYEMQSHMEGAWDQRLHATDYLMYSYLQTGQEEKARHELENAASVTKLQQPGLTGEYALAAIPARYYIERQQWKDAAALQPRATAPPPAVAIVVWARAVGAARSGDTVIAQQNIDQLQQIKAKIESSTDASLKYWAGQVEIQRRSAAAWLAFARHQNEDAMSLMRSAVELEESTEKHPVTPGPVLPAREQMGDLLMETKQPALALAEYETSLKSAPNRFHAIYGAAQAAEMSNQPEKAKAYYAKVVQLCSGCAKDNPSVKRAQQFLAMK